MEDENDIEVEERSKSVRRTFTLRNSAARQVAVNFMPSRQLSYNTLRLRRSNCEHNALLEAAADLPDSPDTDTQADLIVREMEQHERLMEDNLQSEELRREALRDLPQGLTMKRHVRAKLSASVSLRSRRRPISCFKRLKYRLSFAFKRVKDRLRDLVFSVEFWYEAIRNVEGHFGSAVGSYFYFLRWMFALNLGLSVLLLAFVVIPQTLYNPGNYSALGSSGFLDFIAGKGSFEKSLLFYGHYDFGNVGALLSYDMSYAYFFTMVTLYIAFFAVLCYRTAYSYRRNFIEISGGLCHVYANKVFCGWDFGIVTQRAAQLNAASIYHEFKELLNEQFKNKDPDSFWIRTWQRFTNTTVTALVIGSIAALEYGLWYLLVSETRMQRWELVVSMILAVILAVCPLVFGLIVKLEYYEVRTALYVTLARTWLLDATTLGLLLAYWATSKRACWETSLGQEAYRLVLLDALISLLLVPAVEICRAWLFKLNPSMKAPEFNIAYNSFTVIYNQAVLWVGMLFSPLLVVAVTIKFLLLFYVKRECALRACQPATKVWRAAQTQTVFYMLVTLSLFTTLFGIGLLFISSSSKFCGPFMQYSQVSGVLTEGLLRLDDRPVLRAVLAFLTRPGPIAFLLLALGVSVYYSRARARAQQSTVELLRHMLQLQAKDKDFLLAAIAKVSNGEWLYCPRNEPSGSDSDNVAGHTWKYLRDVRRPSNADFTHFDASRLSHSLFDNRPKSYRDSFVKDNEKPRSSDGETDSSFSWKGSNNYLNQKGAEQGEKKWF